MEGPSLEVITSFARCGANVGEMRIPGLGFREAEVQTRDCRNVSSEACCLVRASVGRSDSRLEADSPFYRITKVSRILDATTVLMGIHKGVNEAHHHDPILKASQEHLGDQVMEKMVSQWKHSSMSCHQKDLNMSYKRKYSL